MPTPSSRDGPDAASVNFTCPDEQMPRAPADHSQPSPQPYEETSESPVATPASTQSSRAEDAASSSGSQVHRAQYAADGPQTPYTQSSSSPSPSPSPATSPTTPPGDDHNDAADKQAEPETGVRQPGSTYSSPSGSRDVRAPVGDMRDRRINSRSHIVRSPLRADSRHVARFSIPETNVWQPYGRTHAQASQLGSKSSTTIDAPTSSVAGDNWEDHVVDDDLVYYPEDSPSFVGCDPTSLRAIPSPGSKFLRPGSRFVGTQQSERQVYDVQVEIKQVDLRESFLCGYLRIQGLTEDHPTLTTYFEGEIIGSKYGFKTNHETWGASERIDMSHWGKFAAFRPYQKPAIKGGIFTVKDHLQKENVFMRWKEHFLVPNHRVRTIHGASFEGFYYICFNQIEGVVHGIYFHSKSEKFQQLELKHVQDKGCMSAVEFR